MKWGEVDGRGERIKPFNQRFTWPEWRLNTERSATWVQQLAVFSGYDKVVIDEAPHPYHLMFFRDDIIAYERKLTEEEISKFEAAGYYISSNQAGPQAVPE